MPVDVVTPGDSGGATPSSVVLVILKSGGPMGTSNEKTRGLGPPL
jgi:hypothetical protein